LTFRAEHSDPDKLRQQAKDVRQHEAVKDFLERKQRVAEVMPQEQCRTQQKQQQQQPPLCLQQFSMQTAVSCSGHHHLKGCHVAAFLL
jgi:hypothetical protein